MALLEEYKDEVGYGNSLTLLDDQILENLNGSTVGRFCLKEPLR